MITSMIAFGISMAAAASVGHAVGRNDGPGIKRAGLVAMLLGTLIAALLTIDRRAFSDRQAVFGQIGEDADATIVLTAELLVVAASLFVTDAAQSIAAGGLRGQGHSGAASVRRHCLLVNRLLSWLCAGLKIGLSATGIWIGLSIGTNIDGGLLVLGFQLLASRCALRTVT